MGIAEFPRSYTTSMYAHQSSTCAVKHRNRACWGVGLINSRAGLQQLFAQCSFQSDMDPCCCWPWNARPCSCLWQTWKGSKKAGEMPRPLCTCTKCYAVMQLNRKCCLPIPQALSRLDNLPKAYLSTRYSSLQIVQMDGSLLSELRYPKVCASFA